mmetsp:Transcript_94326/g.211473  ORF Transcript_94326/g.211473 Transcript_94326/m.211473 type:complete len:217 (+) Transcript_94326:212-862(+)
MAPSSASESKFFAMSLMTSWISCGVGRCPNKVSICVISSRSRMPSPLESSFSKTRLTSISMRASLTVYHLRKSLKASLSSLVRGILFHNLEHASSLRSPSEGGTQPSFCMNLLNSDSSMRPSASWSISSNASCREPLSSVTTAMPAVSAMLACCVKSLTIPLRNLDGLRMFMLDCLRSATVTLDSPFTASVSGTTRVPIIESNQRFNRPLIVMKPQ